MSISDCFVSVVAPLSNDVDIIEEFLEDVSGVLSRSFTNYEIVLIDDGSTDATVDLIAKVLPRFSCTRLICLSRSFGLEIAITAGLDAVIGDYVVVMLPNSDPPELIPEMVSRTRKGAGMLLGILRNCKKESFFVRMGTGVFYWYCNRVLKINLPRNSSYFRVMDRQAVNAVTKIKDRLRYLRTFTAYIGYSSQEIEYEPINRRGASKRTPFFEKVNLGISIIVTNSIHPLRLVSRLGLGVSFLNGMYIIYVLSTYLLSDKVVAGWVTSSLQTSTMFFFLFLILAVLSEYVGRILLENQERPLYYVHKEINSPALIVDEERKNVMTGVEEY